MADAELAIKLGNEEARELAELRIDKVLEDARSQRQQTEQPPVTLDPATFDRPQEKPDER